MAYDRGRLVTSGPATFGCAPAEVKVLGEQPLRGVETSDHLECLPPHEEKGAHRPVDLARTRRIPVPHDAHVIRKTWDETVRAQPKQKRVTHARKGVDRVLDRAIREDKPGSHNSRLRMPTGGGDEHFERTRLKLDIGVRGSDPLSGNLIGDEIDGWPEP
jgi:hypothetical protein